MSRSALFRVVAVGLCWAIGPAAALAQAKPKARPLTLDTSQAGARLTTSMAGSGIRTLQQALGAAYSNNPTLTAARAGLRATDETVPAAISSWRPQVIISGTGGGAYGTTTSTFGASTQNSVFGPQTTPGGQNTSSSQRPLYAFTGTVTQPIYRGGRTVAGINRAENQVMSARAQLQVTEQQVFSDTINAYVGVISNGQVLQLDANNEQVLQKQLQATNDRFRVGEITRTDVAQAEAALAQATATREAQEGTLQTSRANFQRETGELPDNLIEPQPLQLPGHGEQDIVRLADANNPNVIEALFNVAAAREAFNLAYSALMPNLSVQAQAFYTNQQQQIGLNAQGETIIGTLTIPIFQGGAEYSAIRQARQQEQQAIKSLDDQRRAATQQAISAFQNYVSAKATIVSNRAAIRANEIALEGVQREAIVGSRTTLDVLNAEQALLNSRVTLVQSLANFVNQSYAVANATGRLTAYDLNLAVPLYDVNAYYREVKNLWIGTGDYATGQPGR